MKENLDIILDNLDHGEGSFTITKDRNEKRLKSLRKLQSEGLLEFDKAK